MSNSLCPCDVRLRASFCRDSGTEPTFMTSINCTASNINPHVKWVHDGWLPWWRHKMETFCALLTFCAGTSPVTGQVPLQRPVTRNFDVFFYQWLNKRLSKQSWGWWLETPSCSLWRHCNAMLVIFSFCGIDDNFFMTRTIRRSNLTSNLMSCIVQWYRIEYCI